MGTDPRIAVLGSGAQGSGIAFDLITAGFDVTLIDQWPAHVEAIRSSGLEVRLPTGAGSVPADALHLCQVAELRHPFDIVLVVVKAYDTRWAVQLIEPYLAEDAFVVGMQNGMTYDTIVDVVGIGRAVGAVIEMASNMFEPGIVTRQNGPDTAWFAIGGEVDPLRLSALQQILRRCGTVEVVDDIRSAKWMKLVANAGELVPSAILDLPLAEAAALPGAHEFMLACGREAARAATAAGSRLVPVFGLDDSATVDPDAYADTLLGEVLTRFSLPDTLTTVLQDWMKGRHAEFREINGHVVDVLGSNAPHNARVVELARRIESGELQRAPHNLGLMLDVASA